MQQITVETEIAERIRQAGSRAKIVDPDGNSLGVLSPVSSEEEIRWALSLRDPGGKKYTHEEVMRKARSVHA